MSDRSHDYSQSILARCKTKAAVRTAVVHPVQANALEAIPEAVAAGLIVPTLIGPKDRILKAADDAKLDISAWEIVDAEHSHDAAVKAVAMAAGGHADAIMKGALHTDELLEPIVKTQSGLRTSRRLSHAFLMSISSYAKPFIITDAAINIAPDLLAKADIVQNAVNLWHVIFGEDTRPKVAILAAVETVNPKMIATIDAAALCKMADRGQITGAVIDGPLAFDNAISVQAAKDKGIVSPVAGNADILLVPEIESGNMLAKQLTFLGSADAAGIVLGARVPVMLTSRADNARARVLSCALAVLLADARKSGRLK
ncbi:MAG: bifunctional enoyl-CoA hydratase/phosphate acetyltransferase [Rhodospirillaceae bacterium]|nr:bifunctional enoyl-CoA hydratase/phosphate acetyltransferase [Rhodospirillaceae bacterium]